MSDGAVMMGATPPGASKINMASKTKLGSLMSSVKLSRLKSSGEVFSSLTIGLRRDSSTSLGVRQVASSMFKSSCGSSTRPAVVAMLSR